MQDQPGLGRALALLVVGWIGMAAVASLSAVVPTRMLPGLSPGPDVVLLVVLHAGLSARGGSAGLSLLAFALGYLADLSAGAPKGLHMAACVLLAQLSRAASSRLMVRGALLTGLVAAFFAGIYHLGLASARVLLEVGPGPGLLRPGVWAPLRQVAPAVLATALWGPVVFAVLRRLDRAFSRDPRTLGGGAIVVGPGPRP